MSGHSHWATIKRKKGAADAKKGAIYTRLGRELAVAAREGGPDPESNSRLRLAVEKARAAAMPKDKIEAAIRRGAGLDKDAAAFDEAMYEGYGPHGVAMLVKVLTDNRNRAVADVRRVFSRHGGNMAEAGAVSWGFEQRGYIQCPRDGQSEDKIFELVLEAGADDVEIGDEIVEIYTAPDQLHAVRTALEKSGLKAESAELVMKPKNLVSVVAKDAVSIMGLIDALEELDDVQQVFSNLDFSEEAVAQYAAQAG
jgi:YebC/PmpR family DNA-binding regulatory protein